MAAAVRIGFGRIIQKYAFSVLSQPKCLTGSQKLGFHKSYLLCVAGQEIKMPSLSPTMSEGTIVKWLKKEGDTVQPGDVLCDVQTDKAVVSFETEEEGVLAKILVPENTTDVKVGTLIALMVAEGEDWKSVEVPASTGAPSLSPATTAPAAGAPPPPPPPPLKKSEHVEAHQNYGPAVRQLLEQYELQVSQIEATGRGGKVLKDDVLQFIKINSLKPKPPKQVPLPEKSKAAAPVSAPSQRPSAAIPSAVKHPGTKYSDLELTNMRRIIAKRLTESKTSIPHAYGSIKCTIDKILALRKQLKSDGIAVSVNDFVIKAVANALLQYPEVNVHWINDKVVHVPTVDVSVAVATDSGLITPIVKNAADKGLEIISSEIRSLAEKARLGKLQPHEFQGGSFTVSNLGMYGINEFSAIINPPQCAILAVGGGKQLLNKEGQSETCMVLTLSYDNRAIEDNVAAQFLRCVSDSLDDPSLLVLGGVQNLRSQLGL